nr:hypothetical protein [Tanacetum cinerariifolium]
MYQEYMAEFWYSAKALENYKVSFSIPTGGIYGEFPTIGNEEEVSTKGTLRKSLLPPRWSKEATRGGSSKAPAGSKTGHSKRRKESSSAMDSNLNRPLVSTLVDTKMHKEDQQATGGPTSLGVTSKERANPQLNIYFTDEVDPSLFAPNDSIPPQEGMNERTKKTSYDHISAGTDPHVLANQTKSISEGLETVLTQPTTEKGTSSTSIHSDKEEASTSIHGDKEEASSTIKLEDLAKLVSQIQPSFKDLDSPEDDPIIIVDESDEDEPNAKTKDTLAQDPHLLGRLKLKS